jgi:3-oxoacyl-[acyl-carrier-protein] synthase-1
MNRVAITGIGIVSCLGNDIKTVGTSLRLGASGIIYDKKREEAGFRSPLTGAVKGFDAEKILSRKQRKTMPDFAVQAYAASMEALTMSGLRPEDIQNERTGLIFGCDSSCIAAVEQVDLLRQYGESKSIGSGFVFRSMTSTITMNLNTLLKTQGACWTISSACSSGGHAVGQAAELIALGKQERIICGGAQEINWESMCSFDAIGAFSIRLEEPHKASRPFDKNRDGLVPGGGAAAVVLENIESAQKRGAPILGEIAAYAFSSDGQNISVPSDNGLQRAMKGALELAGMAPGEIDYVCAHATSTPLGDAAEARGIGRVFGAKTPYVSSLKSMTGHELWMSGASQIVYTAIMAQQGFIAPNINFDEPDEDSARLNIVKETINRPPRTAMCNAAGFGGTNSCIILKFDTGSGPCT